MFDTFVIERAGEVMVIRDVMDLVWPEHHWDHMLAEEICALFVVLAAPALALGLNLAHAHGDLGGMQFTDGNGLEYGFPDMDHRRLPRAGSQKYSSPMIL